MPEQNLLCTLHEVTHPPDGWHEDCTPTPYDPVAALAEVIGEAHQHGIRAGAWSLARWILERWPARTERATVPEAIRDGTTTSRQYVADIMELVDQLNPPPELRARIVQKILFAYAAGMVGGRASRQPEIEAFRAALVGRLGSHREDPE